MEALIVEYGNIVKRAFQVTWRNKALWVFGIAAALFGEGARFGGGGGGHGNGMSYTVNAADIQRWRQYGLPFPRLPWGPFGGLTPTGMAPMWVMVIGLFAVLVLVALVFMVVGVIVRYTSLGAMIGMVNDVEQSEHTSFRAGLRAGWARFLRLFALDLLIGVAAFALVMAILVVVGGVAAVVVVVPTIFLVRAGGASLVVGILWAVLIGMALILVMVLALLAITVFFGLLRQFSLRSCILDRKGIFDALRAGLALTRSRLREGALMWLILVGIGLALGLVSIPLILMGAGLVLGPALLVGNATQSPVAALLAAAPFLLVFVIIGIVVSGVVLAFQSSVWTITYRELTSKQLLKETA
jgi:hypothetical protein